MSRVSPALAAAFAAAHVNLFALVRFEFDSGVLRLSTLPRDLSWNSETWLAAGGLLGFDFASETVEVRSTGGTISLSGLDVSTLALADTENYQGRPVTIYLGAIDSTGAVVVDPDCLFKGIIDTMEDEDEGDTARIVVSVESRAAGFDRPNERRYTPNDQKLRFEGDKGFEFVSAIQAVDLVWG